jgi:hypothetical protein
LSKPNKQKDEKESDTEPSDGRESPVKEVNEKIPLVLKDDDSNKPQDIDSESVIHTVVISLGIVANHTEVESSLLVYFDP